ncbi:unnamed protein product [Rotaria sp. Silwood2]|nr:unnamed protein product [Rotaria sp. Silwood2]CAF2982017.1 unnamed protein product [Rotaria sp. Silwood2]CAF3241559.1 unnamed protein product [Rotaria sp. Silwood2]CAF3955277.1 unnamed protein product [Rotaria sp. Silwood2]CAF4145976.1 unnamed protein product [Rotaria sp. Silwood2]
MSKIDSNLRVKRAYSLAAQLKNVGPTSNAKTKFILESTPFDDGDESPPSGDWTVTGRLLPNSEIYKDGSIRIQLIIGPEYPFKAPKVLIRSTIFHPNVDRNGEICLDLLSNVTSWTPTTSFISIIEEVTKIIDEPSADHIKYPEAASLFSTNKKEYERIATETFKKNCLPRS